MAEIKQRSLGALIFLAAFLVFSCENGPSPIDNGGTTVTTVEFQETVGEFIRYATNDTDKYTRNYIHVVSGSDQNPFTQTEVELKKDSGHASGDFGVVFAYQDDGNYHLLSIDTQGNYSLKSMRYGVLQTIQDWDEDTETSLNTGYGQLNRLRIAKASLPNTYEVYFNDDQNYQTRFVTHSALEGAVGFFVYIGSVQAENFPSQPVDVSFRLISSDDE